MFDLKYFILNEGLVTVTYQTRRFQRFHYSLDRSPKDVANDFIQKKLTENKVVVFCKSYCPYCRRVKGILGDLWNYLNIDVDQLPMQEPLLDALRDMTGKRTVRKII